MVAPHRRAKAVQVIEKFHAYVDGKVPAARVEQIIAAGFSRQPRRLVASA